MSEGVKVLCTKCGDAVESDDCLHFKGEIRAGFCGPMVLSGESVICSFECLNSILEGAEPPEAVPQFAPQTQTGGVALQPRSRVSNRPQPPPPLEAEWEDTPLPVPEVSLNGGTPIPLDAGYSAASATQEPPAAQAPKKRGRPPAPPAKAPVVETIPKGLPESVRELFETPKPTTRPGLPHTKETIARNTSGGGLDPQRASLEQSIRESIARQTGQ